MQSQTTQVSIQGGIFETQVYEANDNDTSQGASLILLFSPNDTIGKDGDTISLVQTVRDTTTLIDPRNGSGNNDTDLTYNAPPTRPNVAVAYDRSFNRSFFTLSATQLRPTETMKSIP